MERKSTHITLIGIFHPKVCIRTDRFIESNPIVSQIPGFRSKSLVNPRSPLISTLTVSLQASSLPRSTKLR